MTDERTVSSRSRVLEAGYLPALWLAPAERFLPPGGPPRTVSIDEAIAEIDEAEGKS
jgi:hypothetical protein